MKLSCKVIEDILPLYYDGICSEDSAALVEEHLQDCPHCSQILSKLRADITAAEKPVDDLKPLKKIQKSYKKLRLGWVIAILCLLVLIPAVIAATVRPSTLPDLFDLIQVDETTFTSISGYLNEYPIVNGETIWEQYEIKKTNKHGPTGILEILATSDYELDLERSNTEGSYLSIGSGEDYDGRSVWLIFYVQQGRECVEIRSLGTNTIVVWVRGTKGYKVFHLTNSETFEKLVEYMKDFGKKSIID